MTPGIGISKRDRALLVMTNPCFTRIRRTQLILTLRVVITRTVSEESIFTLVTINNYIYVTLFSEKT